MEDQERIWWRIQVTVPNEKPYLMGDNCDSLEMAKAHLKCRKSYFRKNTRNKFVIVRFETKMYIEQ